MISKLNLDEKTVELCHKSAQKVVSDVLRDVEGKTTFSIERAIVRLLGVDGVNEFDHPYPNLLIEHVNENGGINDGVSYWLGNAVIHTGKPPQEIADAVVKGELSLFDLPMAEHAEIREKMFSMAQECLDTLKKFHVSRSKFADKFPEIPQPYIYVLTATGSVYEDVVHGLAVAEHGGDIVAVIRSTAQSLYDFVPYGATEEGFGGTFATQENFRIMRKSLDEWAEKNNKYMMLSSFCSGLCMPEIAVMGVIEGLDNMVNDALYGILYRDINMVRTLVDQQFSRKVNGFFGITINTGEDNYPRTSDSPSTPASIVASEMVNYHLAKNAGVAEKNMGLGNAFEIHPGVTNGFLYEWAQAQLTRDLFPGCPVKYMPPTKHMDGNLMRTHACDTLFNLVTVGTQQGIQTIGVPTEGIFTPHIHDRVLGLENTNYVFNFAKNFGDEIEFKQDGIIQGHAQSVLSEASEILMNMAENGLYKSIENRVFGNVSRREDEGKGQEGIVDKSDIYFNPFEELMKDDKDERCQFM